MTASSLHLRARPDPSVVGSLSPGTSILGLSNGTAGLLHVPAGQVRGLVVALHGAGGEARNALDLLQAEADRTGLVVLAPASLSTTWAMIRRGPDPDSEALDAALADVFARQPFDPASLSVAGFSDGGSYALTLGLANGDLFRRVVGFSPGFHLADRLQGRPRFLLTHGVHDRVLPIERTSRRLVPELLGLGLDVTYHEFQGGHVVPPSYVVEAADWLAAPGFPDQGAG
jgi:predicted esterase